MKKTTPKIKLNTIERITVKERQGRRMIATHTMTGPDGTEHRIKTDIERDSYTFQSHARVTVWSRTEGKWNTVDDIPYQATRIITTSHLDERGFDAAAREDERTLIEKAARILF